MVSEAIVDGFGVSLGFVQTMFELHLNITPLKLSMLYRLYNRDPCPFNVLRITTLYQLSHTAAATDNKKADNLASLRNALNANMSSCWNTWKCPFHFSHFSLSTFFHLVLYGYLFLKCEDLHFFEILLISIHELFLFSTPSPTLRTTSTPPWSKPSRSTCQATMETFWCSCQARILGCSFRPH